MTAFSIPKFEHQHVPVWKVARAKYLMRHGWDLDAAALHIGVRSRDLDHALWNHLGNLEDRWESAS